MSISDEDITTLLDKWYTSKHSLQELEKRIEKYKKLAEKAMDQRGTTVLSSNTYMLQRRDLTRKTMSKCDVPDSVWDKYAKTVNYPAYYLTQK